jgi:FMN phosphatase YigB (HAD superfamily)
VGDDVGADVVGAHGVGWRAALVRVKPEDSALPTAPPAPDAAPDLVIDSVLDLESTLGLRGGGATL